MNTYAPKEPRTLFGAAAVALTMLTMATLVVGPALASQRHAPLALPEIADVAPVLRATGTVARMEVVLDRAPRAEVARDAAAAPREARRG